MFDEADRRFKKLQKREKEKNHLYAFPESGQLLNERKIGVDIKFPLNASVQFAFTLVYWLCSY